MQLCWCQPTLRHIWVNHTLLLRAAVKGVCDCPPCTESAKQLCVPLLPYSCRQRCGGICRVRAAPAASAQRAAATLPLVPVQAKLANTVTHMLSKPQLLQGETVWPLLPVSSST